MGKTYKDDRGGFKVSGENLRKLEYLAAVMQRREDKRREGRKG